MEALMALFFLAALIFLVLLIVAAIRRKSKKKLAISAISCLILSMVFFSLSPKSEKAKDTKVKTTAAEVKQEDKDKQKEKEEKQKAEEQKKLDEQKKLEEQKKAEEQKQLEEQKKAEEQKQLEEQKKAEEQKRLDEQRKQEEAQRQQEEQKKQQEAARAKEQEQQKAAADFQLSILMALILIYMVMAGQFERFFDPIVVMFSVPLAIIGVVPTLLLTGTTINIQSLMGMIMLIGIVVNNAIVLVDYINLMRREKGLELTQAVIEAGRLRLRPILMTTLTTVLGLLPLSFGLGAGAEIQASLARVVIGGLTASTLVTLVFIPVVYINTTKLLEKIQARITFPWQTDQDTDVGTRVAAEIPVELAKQ